MKVIVSHDVDHLHPSEHFFKDLYFPKMWIKGLIECVRGHISFKVFSYRFLSIFQKRLNRIEELCEFDARNGVKATYFFGMDNVLGMSYKKKSALPYIRLVKNAGFDVGVHGCNFDSPNLIKKEHDTFKLLTGLESFGVRNHYVRYNEYTFQYMNEAGYLFDTSEFNKKELIYKHPYKVGAMWEFPLAIMDVYVLNNYLAETKKKLTCFIDKVNQIEGSYLTILLHDNFFNEKTFPDKKMFYEWLIEYLVNKGIEFISYKDAIAELENEGKH